jgi:hypothetical protein
MHNACNDGVIFYFAFSFSSRDRGWRLAHVMSCVSDEYKIKTKTVGFEHIPLFIYAVRVVVVVIVVVVGRRRGVASAGAVYMHVARGTLHRYAFNSRGLSAIFVVVPPSATRSSARRPCCSATRTHYCSATAVIKIAVCFCGPWRKMYAGRRSPYPPPSVPAAHRYSTCTSYRYMFVRV